MKQLQLSIISPEGTLFTGEVDCVMLPGTVGRFEVLPQHAPLISSLVKGQLRYRRSGEEFTQEITGGFVEVKNDRVAVCVE